MRRVVNWLLMFVVASLAPPALAVETDTIQDLQNVSVTIRSTSAYQSGQGSGVMFTRDGTTFVWTAAHVIDNLRSTREVIHNGSKKTVVEFKDAEIVQEFREDGRRIGEIVLDAKVLRYSDSEHGEDLALLEIRKKNFTTSTVVFYEGETPEIGTELFHVGSLLGQMGSNSLTTGVISQIGRVLDLGANGTVFDQTTVTAFPGSSGGGVFLKDNGQYCGMLVRGAGETFNLIVPMRRMRDWATRSDVLWALDPDVPMPADRDWKIMTVDTEGDDLFREPTAASKKYPFLYELKPLK